MLEHMEAIGQITIRCVECLAHNLVRDIQLLLIAVLTFVARKFKIFAPQSLPDAGLF